MTFDEWAATCPSLNNIERIVSKLAWNAALDQAAATCLEVNEDGAMMLKLTKSLYDTGRMSAAMMCHDHTINLKTEVS